MLISDAFKTWSEEIRPAVVAQYGESDAPALAESWNDYTDSLSKDGEFNTLQYTYCPAYDDPMPLDLGDELELILDGLGLRMERREYCARPDGLMSDMPAKTRHFKCDVIRGTGHFHVWFSQGSGIQGLPDLPAVLSSLLMDTFEIEVGCDFEEWASDFGYNTDSRKAEKAYKACKDIWAKLETMFTQNEIDGLRDLFADY